MNGSPTTTRRRSRPRGALRLAAALVCTATALAAAAYTVPAVADAAPAPTCAKVTAILVPGTTNPQHDTGTDSGHADSSPSSVLDPIVHALQARYGSDLAVMPDTTPGSPQPGAASPDKHHALSSLVGSLCPTTRVILLGYSDDAQTAGDLATRIGHGHGPVPASRVLAVVLVGDPHRDSSTPQLGAPADGQGVEGPRTRDFGALNDRVRTVCAAGDRYCSASDPVLTALGHAFSGTGDSPTSDAATDPSMPASPDSSSAAPGVIDGLDPTQIIEQVTAVLSKLAEFAADVPAIGNDLAQVPGLVTTGNIAGLHQISGDLNTRFAPLVAAADEVDLHLVSRALTLAAPLDTSGWTAIAAQIVGILANVNIGRIATDVGQAQEIAWGAIEKLATGDPGGAALAMTGLAPIAVDLVTTAASALTGDGGTRLSTLAHTLTTTTTPDTQTALNQLASGIHQNGYTSTTFGPVLDWLSGRIGTTH
ncbi:cutinase family protein [Nocardia nova]|uniref:cutinase family protein n=1 Tax=Nocardia nova TaxID=37330 RepID=UPI0033F1BC4E